MGQFKYYPRTDTYECPAGERMQTNGKWYNKNLKNGRKSYYVKHYKTKACNGCELRTEQRQQIIEHQFGTLKRHQHFDYTLMRGKANVLSEVYIAFTMYNFRRSLSVLGISELLKRLRAAFEHILVKLTVTNVFAGHGNEIIFNHHMHRGRLYRNVIE